MNIFFDMDQTLLGTDDTLRPGVKEVLQRLKDDGHTLYIWSGVGIRWAEVHQHGLESVITDCFVKPLQHYVQGREKLGLPVKPDLVVDDYPEVPTALGGIWIRPYLMSHHLFHRDGDDEMERVYRIITEYARDGHSTDERFHPVPQGDPR